MPKPNLTRITTTRERALLRAWNESIASIKDSATIKDIERLLDNGNIEGVVRILGLDEAAFRPVEEAIRQAYIEGGTAGATQIGRIPVESGTMVMRFNVRNRRAEQWLETNSSGLITEIADEQRSMVREQLSGAMSRGVNPRTSALDLVGRIDPGTRNRRGGIVGMTSRQAQWTANARSELENLDPNYLTRELRDRRLDGRIRRAIQNNEPLDAKTIDTAITRLQARTVRYRGEVISRTESLNALRAGQHESIRQAIDQGEIDEEDAVHVWDATGDRATRPAHAAADGQRQPIGEPFIVGGYRLMYPGDSSMGAPASQTIQCRCRERVTMDFAGMAKKEIEGFG